MSLKKQIDEDIKKAMLAKEKDRLRALRAIKSLIMLEETKEGAADELTQADEIKLLSKAAKQRKESAEIFQTQNRLDLAQKEIDELAVIEEYLPKQLSEEELQVKIQEIITQLGASSPADMGKVMGIASKQLAGMADGKLISQLVKTLLQN
ncbi:MAG: GatB/YqeY domain-containing protein [Microscillaceae bacterium]|nr:GatB/YqeY domain-containing protein [Microscillaceae bacterium]